MKVVFIHLEIFCVNTFVNLFRRDVDMVEIRLLLLRKPCIQKCGVYHQSELTAMPSDFYLPSLVILTTA